MWVCSCECGECGRDGISCTVHVVVAVVFAEVTLCCVVVLSGHHDVCEVFGCVMQVVCCIHV